MFCYNYYGDSMNTFIVAFVIIIIVGLIGIYFKIKLDNIGEYIIRINEAETNLDAALSKRYDLLNKSIDIIKKYTNKEENILETIESIRSQKLSNFELDKQLYKGIEEFHNYAEEEPNIKDNDDYSSIEIALIESESEIVALKTYYNDITTEYNKLVSTFPSNIIGKIKGYKVKEQFELENHLDLINSLK